MILGGDARRGGAESEPRVALSMGKKILEIPPENEGFQRSWGGGARRDAAESEPRVALSMWYENARNNKNPITPGG